MLIEAITTARGRELEISHRVRGTRARWQQLAVTNAEQALAARLANRQHVAARFEALAEALDLDEPPQRLECFDISHSSGEATVASCVVFGPRGAAEVRLPSFQHREASPPAMTTRPCTRR